MYKTTMLPLLFTGLPITKLRAFKALVIIGVYIHYSIVALYAMEKEYDRALFYHGKFKHSEVKKEEEKINFFTLLPREIRNNIAQYLLKEEVDRSINYHGMGIYPAAQKLEFKSLIISRDEHRSLFFLDKTKEASSFIARFTGRREQLFAAEGSLWHERVTSLNGHLTMFEPQQQAVLVNISPNKKFVAFLVALHEDMLGDCYPIALHVIDLLQKQKVQQKLLLKPLVESPNTCWNKSRITIKEDDKLSRKKLEQQGYEAQSPGNMHNDLTSLSIANDGKTVAIADQTGIMLIDMDAKSVEKVVDKKLISFAAFGHLNEKYTYRMGFDQLGSNLWYKPKPTDDLECIPVSHDSSEDLLEEYFRKKGFCKTLPSLY